MPFQLPISASKLLKRFQNSLQSRSAFLFGGLMMANAVAYGYHIILARMMSPADYGVLVTLTSISYVLHVMMRTIQAWVIKEVSALPAVRDARQVQAVFAGALRTLVPLGVVVLIGHGLVSPWAADFLHLDSLTPIWVLGLYTFSSFLVPVPRAVLLGLDRLRFASVVSVLDTVFRVAIGVALVVRTSEGLQAVGGALMGYAIGNLLAFIVALLPLWPLLRRLSPEAPARVRLIGLDRYALAVLLINTFLMIITSIDQVAVKRFFSEQVAGNYAVAFLLGQIITTSTMALSWVIFTRSATTSASGGGHPKLLRKGLLVVGTIAVTLTLGYLVAPVLAVRLMGGSQYALANAYVGLIGIENTLFAFVYVQSYYLISVRKTQVVWPLSVATLLIVVLLAQYHATVQQILWSLILVMSGLLIYVSALSWQVFRANRRLALRSSDVMQELPRALIETK